MGRDRELFINLVLSNIISVPLRLGTGDIVDPDDNLARQSDVVIEYSNTLSFPNIYPSAARLYLAESVCAVIEVKSTISVQWKSVLESATQLNKLTNPVYRSGRVCGQSSYGKGALICDWLYGMA